MPTTVSLSAPARALLAGAIDYAGLFPPASLDLTGALQEYLTARQGDDSWALGRFVAPASRLDQLWHTLAATGSTGGEVRVSALIGLGTADDVDAIESFNRSAQGRAVVDAVEAKAPSASVARAVLAGLPPGWSRYLEVALGPGLEPTLDVIAAGRAFAKIRTGGVTTDAFPDPDRVLDFLEGCVRRKLPFKATAGLHHPVGGDYRLTYEPDAARGRMYGYLNLFAAASLLWSDRPRSEARAALVETRAAARGDQLDIGGSRIPAGALVEMRARFAHGFGSCSFREPLNELRLLESA